METNHADFCNQTDTWKVSQTLYQAPIFSSFVPTVYYWTSTTNAADTSEAAPFSVAISKCMTFLRHKLATRLPRAER